MDLGEVDVVERDARLFKRHGEGALRAFEGEEVAARHRQAVADMGCGAKADGPLEILGVLVRGQHQRGGPVGDERAIGEPQRRRDLGVLVGDFEGLREAVLALHVGERVLHGVAVVLHRDLRHRLQRAAIPLGIVASGDAEDLREAEFSLVLVILIAGSSQRRSDVRRRAMGHLFRANNQNRLRLSRLDRVHSGMDRG